MRAAGDPTGLLFFSPNSFSVADAEYEVTAKYVDHGKPPLFGTTGVARGGETILISAVGFGQQSGDCHEGGSDLVFSKLAFQRTVETQV